MTPANDNELKQLFHRASNGDGEAVNQLWTFFYPKLKSVVLSRIANLPRLTGEASDLTSEALFGFICETVRTPEMDLSDINRVWCLMKLVAMRHINDVAKSRFAIKRGGKIDTSSLDGFSSSDGNSGDVKRYDRSSSGVMIDQKSVDPCESVMFDEMVDNLLAKLPDDISRQIFLLRLQNRTTGEIAELLRISIRTVQRRLKEIERVFKVEQSKQTNSGEDE